MLIIDETQDEGDLSREVDPRDELIRSRLIYR